MQWGLGRHNFYLSKTEAINASKWSRSAVPPNLTASLLARISLCLFMLRIVDRRKKYKIFLWAVMGLTTVTTLTSCLNSLLGCRPIEKMWNKELEGVCSPPHVAVAVGITQTVTAILGDWLVALFPILILKDLNMAKKTRIALGILMGLGVFVGAAALMKAQQLYTLGTKIDTTWDTVSLTCWSMLVTLSFSVYLFLSLTIFIFYSYVCVFGCVCQWVLTAVVKQHRTKRRHSHRQYPALSPSLSTLFQNGQHQ